MTPETKLRSLASANPTLQAFFGTGPFRWFDTQLPPGYISRGTCARIFRVSTIRHYNMAGLMDLSQPLFQCEVLDADSGRARAAAAAVIAWLGTIDCSTSDMWTSSPTTPPSHPVFVLNQRHTIDFQLDPPVPVEQIDFRLWNLEP